MSVFIFFFSWKNDLCKHTCCKEMRNCWLITISGRFHLSQFSLYVFELSQLNLDPAAAAAAKSLQSCPTLCDPIDGSPPGSPVPGILQARTLVVIFLYKIQITFQYIYVLVMSNSCDPMSCSPLGFSVHGILQTRILEWIAISSSRGSFQPWD